MTAERISDTTTNMPGVEFFAWADGTQQFECSNMLIERITKCKTKRKKWHHVNRQGNEMYPDIIAGPFHSYAAVMAYIRIVGGEYARP